MTLPKESGKPSRSPTKMNKKLHAFAACLASIGLLGGVTYNTYAQEGGCECCEMVACYELLTKGVCVRNLNSNQALGSTPVDPNEAGGEAPGFGNCGTVWRFGLPTTSGCGQPNILSAC